MESILFFGLAQSDNSDRLSFYDDLCKKVSGFNLNVFWYEAGRNQSNYFMIESLNDYIQARKLRVLIFKGHWYDAGRN